MKNSITFFILLLTIMVSACKSQKVDFSDRYKSETLAVLNQAFFPQFDNQGLNYRQIHEVVSSYNYKRQLPYFIKKINDSFASSDFDNHLKVTFKNWKVLPIKNVKIIDSNAINTLDQLKYTMLEAEDNYNANNAAVNLKVYQDALYKYNSIADQYTYHNLSVPLFNSDFTYAILMSKTIINGYNDTSRALFEFKKINNTWVIIDSDFNQN